MVNMIRRSVLATAYVAIATAALAQAPASVTATCKDGSKFSGATRSGACSRHGGVAAFDPAPATSPKVWVNTGTKVYHCPGDPAYGKTKAGAFLTEAAAKAAGDRGVSGKSCPAENGAPPG